MNILQMQDNLKDFSDQVLQKELLQPSGAVPSYLVLTELQRRQDVRKRYAGQQPTPSTSMADEFARGMGSADAGNYGEAVRGSMPGAQMPGPEMGPQGAPAQPPMQGEAPIQTQGFAGGGYIAPMGQPLGGLGHADTALNLIRAATLPALFKPAQKGPEEQAPTPAPMAPAAPTPIAGLGIGTFDGSAGGATGDGSGTGGDAGTVGAGVGTGVGASAAEAAAAEGAAAAAADGSADYADGGGVEDPRWWLPSRSRGRAALGLPAGQDAPSANGILGYGDLPTVNINRALPPAPQDTPSPTYDYSNAPPENAFPVPSRHPFQPSSPLGNNRAMPIGSPDPLTGAVPRGQSTPPYLSPKDLADWANGPAPQAAPPQSAPSRQGNYGDPNAPAVPPSDNGLPRGLPSGVPPQDTAGGGGGAGAGGGASRAGAGLNIGGSGLADYINEVRALMPPDRFGEMEGRNKEDRDKLRAAMETDKGLALLNAGLGIMGGTSPFAAVNIGQGAQAGIKYWNDASKENRLAEQAIRQAENQITIARANRDERGLEMGQKLYAHAQEMKQRAADRASQAGIAAANRDAQLSLKKMELDETAKDREERREQSRINELGTMATRYTSAADALDMKVATLAANPLASGDPTAMAEMNRLKAEAQNLRTQAENSAALHRSAVIDREVRSGRLVRINPSDPGKTEDGKPMKKNQRFVDPMGNIRVWQGE